MDGLGWDGSQVVTSTGWSTQLQQVIGTEQDSFLLHVSNSGSCSCKNMNTYFPEEVLWSTQSDQDQLQKSTINPDRPVIITNPDATPAQELGPSLLFTTTASTNNGFDKAACLTGSLESLDCLLSASATNSNTDTSVDQDDGISMIFPDCRNSLWNINANITTAVVSSGESDNNNFSLPWSACDPIDQETISQCSSEKVSNSNSKLVSCKRSYSQINNCSTPPEGGFKPTSPKPKKPRSEKRLPSSSTINFQQAGTSNSTTIINEEPDPEAIAQMKEMIYRAAAFRPVDLGMEIVEKPKRKNVRISTDPQTVAARQRRERISERIRVLQRLVPGGSKMDTASMLDEAANYLKYLRSQVKALENIGHKLDNSVPTTNNISFASLPFNFSSSTAFPMQVFNSSPLQNPTHQNRNLPQI